MGNHPLHSPIILSPIVVKTSFEITMLLFIIPLAALLVLTILFWSSYSTKARYTFGIMWLVGAAVVWFATGSLYFLSAVHAILCVVMLFYLKITQGINL